MLEIRVTAYAKINLTLDVLGKRPDGYHHIESVMQSVNLRDIVTVRQREKGIAVRCSRPGVPCDQSNTAFKAARAFFEASGLSEQGIEIEIQKGIPMEAGLAGGSADAAAVLLALNRMFDEPLNLEQLSFAALQVGADVPFCLVGGSMRAEGIGEKLTPLPQMPNCHLLLAPLLTPRQLATHRCIILTRERKSRMKHVCAARIRCRRRSLPACRCTPVRTDGVLSLIHI